MDHRQQGSIAAITGANAGIGLALTKRLLAEGWQVIALNRSSFSAGDASIQEAIRLGTLRCYNTGDLTDYASLRQSLATLKSNEQHIDLLFNNAGRSTAELRYSSQGREHHYELMTVVPYIILMELKPLLQRGHFKTVINTSSSALKFAKALRIETLERPKQFRKLIGPYASAKLALSLWTEAIAPQLAQEGIRIRSVDPGGNNTLRKGEPSGLPLVVVPLMKLFFSPPSHGAKLLYEAAFGQHRDKTGVFLLKDKVTPLKLAAQGPMVLERVREIYETSYR